MSSGWRRVPLLGVVRGRWGGKPRFYPLGARRVIAALRVGESVEGQLDLGCVGGQVQGASSGSGDPVPGDIKDTRGRPQHPARPAQPQPPTLRTSHSSDCWQHTLTNPHQDPLDSERRRYSDSPVVPGTHPYSRSDVRGIGHEMATRSAVPCR